MKILDINKKDSISISFTGNEAQGEMSFGLGPGADRSRAELRGIDSGYLANKLKRRDTMRRK